MEKENYFKNRIIQDIQSKMGHHTMKSLDFSNMLFSGISPPLDVTLGYF